VKQNRNWNTLRKADAGGDKEPLPPRQPRRPRAQQAEERTRDTYCFPVSLRIKSTSAWRYGFRRDAGLRGTIRGLAENVRVLPGFPRQVGLRLAGDESPVDGADAFLLGDWQYRVKRAATGRAMYSVQITGRLYFLSHATCCLKYSASCSYER